MQDFYLQTNRALYVDLPPSNTPVCGLARFAHHVAGYLFPLHGSLLFGLICCGSLSSRVFTLTVNVEGMGA